MNRIKIKEKDMPSSKKRIKEIDDHLENLGVAEEPVKTSYDELLFRYGKLREKYDASQAELERLKHSLTVPDSKFCGWTFTYNGGRGQHIVFQSNDDYDFEHSNLDIIEIDDLINFLTQVKEKIQ